MTTNQLLLASWAAGLLCVNAHSGGAAESASGTPGVATQRAVVNFAELARQTARLAPLARQAGPAAPARFAPAGLGGPPPSPVPASSFLALLGDGELWDKPDTQGAVGPNHLMVALNTSVRIQDRYGAVISTVSLSNFWSALGPFNVQYFDGYAWDSIGDPKVIFDPYANRFILVTEGNVGATNSVLLVGVSQTGDPTGHWNLYRFDVDASHLAYHDYPFMGFNKDWIAVQGIMFAVPGNGFSRVHIYVFNKANLYAGGNGAFTLFSRSDIGSFQTPAVTFDTNISTLYLLQQMGEYGTSINTLRIFTITGPVGSEVLTIGPTVTATNRWNFTAPGGWNSNFSPQLGSPVKIMTKGANFYSLVYRNGSLWAAQTIYLPAGGAATRNAIQWWEISPAGSILQRGLIDDPTGTTFYDFPSLAVNQFNDVLIGYSRFSSNQYASANYSFRAGADPPNNVRGDAVLKAGEAPRDVTLPNYPYNTWGDYSATMVDPLNDTDLWTIQEYESMPVPGGLWGGDNWGTWWGRIVPPLSLGLTESTVTEADTGTTNALFTIALSRTNEHVITVDFVTVDGSAMAGQDYIATNGTVVFNPGELSKLISVSVLGDLLDEANETFSVTLNNPTNVLPAYTQWTGTILDSDPPPAISINDISVREGDAGLADATFTLSLSATSGLPVSVRMITANGTATLRVDYVPTNIMVTIPPGVTRQPVTIKIISDTLIESNETFFVNLSSPTNATIADSQGVCTVLDDDFKVTAVEFGDGDVRLSFTTQSNQTYRVDRTESLATPILWEPVPGATNVPGTGAVVSVLDAGAASRPQRFYRIRVN